MDENYLLVIDGKPAGPYDIEQLKDLKIKPNDFVKTSAMIDYKEAHEIAELRGIFGFRQQSVTPQYFGAFDQRILAAIIDWLLVGGILVIITYLPVLLITNSIIRAAITASLLIIIPIAYLIYHIVMEASPKQATYGKMILKIRVCNIDGSPIDRQKAAARNFAKILSFGTLCIGYLMCFFNKKQQCLHDMLADTLVIKDRLV